MTMAKVEGYEGLYRDPSSKAIINKNKKAWANHKIRRKAQQEREERITALESDVAEIKDMLHTIMASLKPNEKSD